MAIRSARWSERICRPESEASVLHSQPHCAILADNIEKDERISIWVPKRVIPYREHGVLKVDCPECGHAQVVPEFTEALIVDCESCQEEIRVLPLIEE
jgi:ribosomal protein S27E